MSSILSEFNRVVSLLPNRGSADTPRTWTVNGERGYRHGNPDCHKLARAENVRTHGPSTPAEEVTVRPCPDCFIVDFVCKQPAPYILRRLQHVSRPLSVIERHASEGNRTLDDLYEDRESLERVAQTLEMLEEKPETKDHYSEAMARLQGQARALLDAGRTELLSRTPELLNQVAINTILPDRYNAEASLLDAAEAKALQGGNRGSWELLEVFDDWARHTRNPDGIDVEALLDRGRRCFELTHLVQLDTVPAPTEIPPGETLREVSAAAWAAHRDALVERIVHRWTASLTDALAKDTPTLVAVYDFRGSALARQLLDTFEVYKTADRRVSVLRAPEIAATWLSEDGREHGYRNLMALGRRVHTATNVDDPAVVETAAALWDPTSDGPYATFAGAVQAAEALLA